MPAVLTTLRHLGPQACADFLYGLGACCNTRGIPPVSQPTAQCWFQIYDTNRANCIDTLVMCRREQLSETPPGDFQLFFSDTITWRSCKHCGTGQVKEGAVTFGKKPRFQMCAVCGTHYCNTECQKADWVKHKLVCVHR